MYFETVDWATSKPSISNSPWIRDAPHRGFSLLIRWIRSRRPRSIFGRPALFRDFQRQTKHLEASAMPPYERLRLNDRDDLQDRREPSIQLDKKPAVVVPQPNPALNLTPQYDQLTSERRILCLKPALRLEWRGQNGQDEAEQSEHGPQMLGGMSCTERTMTG